MLFKRCLNNFFNTGKQFFTLASKEAENAVIKNIANGDNAINGTLYDNYSKGLRKAVDRVFAEDNGNGLSDRLRANVARFAAYKAYNATADIQTVVKKTGNLTDAEHVLHAYNRWHAAEYNTTVSRSRTAKQFNGFMQEDNQRLFPNLRWLPSRSANPREQHRVFYNRIWAKTDPFWSKNQPGNLWNCKCDWEETDDNPTDGNPTTGVSAKGLDGNPALTGEVFTDNCSYVQRAGKEAEMKCEVINRIQTAQIAKEALIGKTAECTVGKQKYEVEFIGRGIDHYARDIFGEKSIFWIKNEILPKIQDYIKNAECVGRKVSDTGHNTNIRTLRLKEQTDYFYYFQITLPNGKSVCLHLGRYNDKKEGKEGGMYLYSITKKAPKEMEEI